MGKIWTPLMYRSLTCELWTGEPNSVPPSPTSPQCTACEMAEKREGYH